MIKLLISLVFFNLLFSCKIQNPTQISEMIPDKEDIKKLIQLPEKKQSEKKSKKTKKGSLDLIKYHLGEEYFIEGVKYIPEENYNYNEVGLANFYGKELHKRKTINNDYNNVTELLGRHKTLPIPSIVKITNLDNGLSLTVKINDRHNDNSSIIQVSRKVAQLLKFYKNKIAKVRVEILADPSKQMKVVTLSMNEPSFNETIESAPTESVSISNIEQDIVENNSPDNTEQPIEIGFQEIENSELFLKVYEFKSYNQAKSIISEIDPSIVFTTQNEGNTYTLIIGPLKNEEANNLVLSFISKGYKKTEFILE